MAATNFPLLLSSNIDSWTALEPNPNVHLNFDHCIQGHYCKLRYEAQTSGSSTGTDTEWVRLQSSDGFSYIVKRKVAQASGTIRNMLDPESGYVEALSKICEIRERGIIVEKMVEYMAFKTHYETVNTKDEIPLNEFLERIPPEIILELLLAADYQEM